MFRGLWFRGQGFGRGVLDFGGCGLYYEVQGFEVSSPLGRKDYVKSTQHLGTAVFSSKCSSGRRYRVHLNPQKQVE